MVNLLAIGLSQPSQRLLNHIGQSFRGHAWFVFNGCRF
jgi:hypothetical protein